MEIINNKLIAGSGMTLTDGDAFGKTVHLASGADASKWYEITDAEAERLRLMAGEPATVEEYRAQLDAAYREGVNSV